MNIENICRFKKVLDRYLQSSRTKNFIKIKLSKKCKKIISDPLGLVRQYNSPNPYCSPSIIMFLNIPGKDLTGSLIPFFLKM